MTQFIGMEGALADVSFGEWLKRQRSALGLTQAQLAKQINCSTSALRKFEGELRRPSAAIVDQLAKIFNVPENERKSFLRFARGDWAAISSEAVQGSPWQESRAQTTHRSNLPSSTSSFIGREKEQGEITSLISKNRLVTLVGVGGIGKTRLAIQTASKLLNDFPDGVWLIELAPLSTSVHIPQVIVATLGLFQQANRSPEAILTDFLQSKKSLLIFDNCEHLIKDCAELIETLLHLCPDLHILATSREVLSIAGEAIYVVPPLTLPDPEYATPEVLTQYEAVELFIERAQNAATGFTMTSENASAIAQVCQQLDGIPLALELAAARVKLLPVEEIAERLDDRFQLLRGGARTALPRHQALQAMIDWSHDLLSDPERIALRRLSVFAGGWTLEAAESVCVVAEQERDLSGQVLDILTSLVNKSLLLVERTAEQETRYHMLETIRQYAHKKLSDAGEEKMLSLQHLAYFVDLAERAEPHLRAFEMVLWLDRLETEHDNIHAALEWAQESDIESQLRLASALLWFWHLRGRKKEGIEWLERALSLEALDRGNQSMTTSRAMIRGKALNASSSLMIMNHESANAPRRLEESLALFKELGPIGKQGMAYALLRLGSQIIGNNQTDRLLEQSLELFRELGDKFGIAECLMMLAGRRVSFAPKENDYSLAVLFEEQLALRREIGDQDGIAVALTSLSDLAFAQDDYQKAISLHEEAVANFRAVRNTGAVSLSLIGYGDIFFWQGDHVRASEIYGEALSLAQALGYKFLIAFNVYSLGVIDWLRGNLVRAVGQITASQSMFQNISYHWLNASSLHALGDIALARDDAVEALKWYEEELSYSREIQFEAVHAFALLGLGKVAWEHGSYTLAIQHFEQALGISRTADIRPATFQSLYYLGRTAQSRDDMAAARGYYTEALKAHKRRILLLFEWTGVKTYQSIISYPLAGSAVLAVMQKQMARAAHLFGAAEGLYAPLRFRMSAMERAEHDQAIVAARADLGKKAFAAAYEAGKRMSLEEAIAFALHEEGSKTPKSCQGK